MNSRQLITVGKTRTLKLCDLSGFDSRQQFVISSQCSVDKPYDIGVNKIVIPDSVPALALLPP